MITLERLRKGMVMNKDTKEKDKKESITQNEDMDKTTEMKVENSENNNMENKNNKNENSGKNTQTKEDQKTKKDIHERKISFSLNKSLLPDIKIENSINSLFKLIPSFNVPLKDEVNKESKDNENVNEPEIIVLDNSDESLMIYQQKMIDLREENNFLKNQIKEYVSKVAWLEEHFTIRQENANIQHLQELEHIRKTNEKETDEYLERIKELEDEVGILQTELTRQTDLLADEKEKLTSATSTNWALEKKVSELEDKLRIKNSESIDLKAQIINIKEQLETKTEYYNEIEKKYNTLKSDSLGFTTEIERLKKENSLLTEKKKIYDNISKRSSISLESRFYNNLYSPTTLKTKTNSEFSLNLYPTSNDSNSINNINSTSNNKLDSSDTKINSLSLSQTLNQEDSIMSNSTFLEDTDLNDLMDEINLTELQTTKPNKQNIYELSEHTQNLLSEKNKDDNLSSVTQTQNVLTEINLD
ncbi:hypothetical protein BCR36DRAFT_353512 [Piromyces finnis]|uniref:Uncharacterized protein n=1 Tax=Piromyces finnis TaxID=1754191 RepID=A0A1Y1V8L7_9FUNG|nr:hypothetical protein BCR36DRAFT_353512 [Piromyces finnis]|eukprot:ORX49751.1 hypothetical protein BCR36DRAFT_353512 [Piromyces finnis]